MTGWWYSVRELWMAQMLSQSLAVQRLHGCRPLLPPLQFHNILLPLPTPSMGLMVAKALQLLYMKRV